MMGTDLNIATPLMARSAPIGVLIISMSKDEKGLVILKRDA